MWARSGSTLHKTPQKCGCAHKLLCTFRQDRCNTNRTAFKTNSRARLLIWVDLGRLQGSIVAPLGITLKVLGAPGDHPWDQKKHFGPPWRTFATKHQKQHKRSLYGYQFWDPKLMTLLVFTSVAFTCFSLFRRASDVQMTPESLEQGFRKHTF